MIIWSELILKARLCNVHDVLVFTEQCQQVYYTYTPSFRKDRSRVNWLSVLKTKPKGCIKVVKDENDESNEGDDIFQFTRVVDSYRVGSSIDLEENLNFRIADNIFVNVNAEELNVVLSSNRQAQVNEDDDNNEINVEDYDGAGQNTNGLFITHRYTDDFFQSVYSRGK